MSLIGHVVTAAPSIKHDLRYKPGQAFANELKTGFKGSMLSVPFIAFEAGTAQKGELVGTLAGRGVGLCTYPAVAGVVAAGLAMIPGINIGVGILAAVVAMYPNTFLENSVIRSINWLGQTGKSIRHLEMGGSYVDTSYNQHTRQLAMMELSSATGASRRYLGNEGLIQHR